MGSQCDIQFVPRDYRQKRNLTEETRVPDTCFVIGIISHSIITTREWLYNYHPDVVCNLIEPLQKPSATCIANSVYLKTLNWSQRHEMVNARFVTNRAATLFPQLQPAGLVSYFTFNAKTLLPETIFIHRMELSINHPFEKEDFNGASEKVIGARYRYRE